MRSINKEHQSRLDLEKTQSHPQREHFQELIEWVRSHGGYFDKRVVVPAVFTGGETGLAVRASTAENEAMMGIPFKVIMTPSKFLEDPDLGPIFQKGHQMFNMKTVEDADFNILSLGLFYELIKGKDSFYYPYTRCFPGPPYTLMDRSKQDIMQCGSEYIQGEYHFLKEQLGNIFVDVKKLVLDVEPIFRKFGLSEQQMRLKYMQAYSLVMTRCYGWSLPETCLVPLADMCNHSDKSSSTHYIVNFQLENGLRQHPGYVMKKERLNLQNLGVKDIPAQKQQKVNKKDRYIKMYFQQIPEAHPDDLVEHINYQRYKDGAYLTELEYYSSTDEQDNDSDEEEKDKRKEAVAKIRTNQITLHRKKKNQKKTAASDEPEGFYMNNGQTILEEVPMPRSKQDDSEDQWEEEKDWSWINKTGSDTMFTVVTMKKLEAGEQLYNGYGRRTNRFLLMWYGFALKPNKYDSYGYRIKLSQMRVRPMHELPDHMVFRGWLSEEMKGLHKTFLSKEFRMKAQRLDLQFIAFLRMYLLQGFPRFQEIRCFQIPTSILYERYILEFYLLVLVSMLEQFKKYPGKKEQQDVIEVFREGQQMIVHEQRNLVRVALSCIVQLTKGLPFKDIVLGLSPIELRKLRVYLNELQQFALN